jgi:hypothetical protein
MGDVKLTARQTADLLKKLDEGMRSVSEARNRIIAAMAARRNTTHLAAERRRVRRPARKPRP